MVVPSPARTVCVQFPLGANFFRCRYKKIHLFPTKYTPYSFLLWADTRNVVATSPARTLWVQIPPSANFFRCRYKKIHIFPAKYRPYAFLLWADMRNVVAPSPARAVWVQIPPGANFFRCRYKQIHFFRPNIDHMPFCMAYGICMAYGCNLMVGSNPPGANFFRCRYNKKHFFLAKYRPYAFLLCADTRNVVAPSPARTVWVQIPPGANFFRCRYKKIYLFRPNIDHMPFCYFIDIINFHTVIGMKRSTAE